MVPHSTKLVPPVVRSKNSELPVPSESWEKKKTNAPSPHLEEEEEEEGIQNALQNVPYSGGIIEGIV